MDSLPLELHSQIFQFACTDDGSTARSLSLVSQYVREASQPFLLQSVAVSGLSSLTELVSKLQSLPSHKRRVRHLFLSDWTQKQTQQKVVSSDDTDMERYDTEKDTIIRILDLVAPTLESLSFIAACPFNSSQLLGCLFSTKFPRLVDLFVHGFYPAPHAEAAMPALERLHLSGNRNPHGLLLKSGLDAACPSLAHLQISGITSAPAFAEELEHALLPNPDKNAQALFPVTLPSRLRRLSIRTGSPSDSKRRSASSKAQHQKMCERLEALKSHADSMQNVQYDLAEGPEGIDYHAYMKREWVRSLTAQNTLTSS